MDIQTQCLHNEVNKGIIKCRGVYSLWCKKHNISYNKMLVFYTIREYGFCTQKQICDNYLLPRQTMNNVITNMCNEGLLEVSNLKSKGKEKAFVLTDKGIEYSKEVIESLNNMEERATEIMGREKISEMIKLVFEYDLAIARALEEIENE